MRSIRIILHSMCGTGYDVNVAGFDHFGGKILIVLARFTHSNFNINRQFSVGVDIETDFGCEILS